MMVRQLKLLKNVKINIFHNVSFLFSKVMFMVLYTEHLTTPPEVANRFSLTARINKASR